jgi:hypothetical protein
MREIAKKTDFFYLSLKNLGRQNLIFPSKFQTYLNYSKPIIFIGDISFCKLIEENSLGYSININDLRSFNEILFKINNLSLNDKIYFSEKTKKYFNENFNLRKIINTFCEDILND